MKKQWYSSILLLLFTQSMFVVFHNHVIVVHAFFGSPTTFHALGWKACTDDVVNDETFCFSLQAMEKDDMEDEEQEEEQDLNLGDWRKFRASLIAREEEQQDIFNDEDKQKSNKNNKSNKENTVTIKSVSKENEVLLEQQNSQLAKEYKEGVWAHLIAEPEVGGLLCRMPIEGELYWGTGYWKKRLDTMLSINTMGPPKSQMAHWFQMAERMLAREMEVITGAGKNGILNPNDLETVSKELLDKYLHYKQTWQEVCLMLGSTQAVVINRPISQNINKQLAKMLLEGQQGESTTTTTTTSSNLSKGNTNNSPSSLYPYEFLDKFVQAFSEGAVYMGGPDLQSEPALMVHGIEDLDGATELAPGTGIYLGGIPAAVEGVLEGRYQPLDFRFFLGRQVYENPSDVKEKITQGAYKPVACNRSLALKQCLGLPKPLWHEVLELCGGDMKALSDIELSKRTDLQK